MQAELIARLAQDPLAFVLLSYLLGTALSLAGALAWEAVTGRGFRQSSGNAAS